MMAALIYQLRTPHKKRATVRNVSGLGNLKLIFFTTREKNAYFRKNALYLEGDGMSPSS